MSDNEGTGEGTIDISVRLAEPTTDDIQDTATLLMAVDQGRPFPASSGIAPHLRFVEDEVLGPGSSTLVALAHVDGLVSGGVFFCVVHPVGPLKGGLFVQDLFVFAETHEQKVGRALIHFLADFCVDMDLSEIQWSVSPHAAKARGFYEELGAHPVDDRILYKLDEHAIRSLSQSPKGLTRQ